MPKNSNDNKILDKSIIKFIDDIKAIDYDENKNIDYEDIAIQKYKKWKCKDPFPKITSSLLNHEEILRYISITGMITPFHYSDLHGITYDARLSGKCIYWEYIEDSNYSDNLNKQTHKRFKKKIIDVIDNTKDSNKEIIIKPNSIVFVTLEPTFRIPDYIVLRYNFRIINIYRGLLLGTGPIIDPGFQGKLSIPIHNLTNNEYRFQVNDAIISIEFTKINPMSNLIMKTIDNNSKLSDKYNKKIMNPKLWVKPFSGKKTVEDYIYDSLKDQSVDTVGNSIPAVRNIIDECNKNVTEETKKTKSIIQKFEIIGILSVIVALATLALPTWIAFSDIQKERVEYNHNFSLFEEKTESLEEDIINILLTDCDKELSVLCSDLDKCPDDIKKSIEDIKSRFEKLEKKFFSNKDQNANEMIIKEIKEIKQQIETIKNYLFDT
ncbi:MAG: hypothetical protein MJ076_04340 [Clostridia bacterium]|nr:hypothetical protein [Clostridia bacterium]